MTIFVLVLSLFQAGLWTKDFVKSLINKSSNFDKATRALMKAYKTAFHEVLGIKIKDLAFWDEQTEEFIKGGDIDTMMHVLSYLENPDTFAKNICSLSGIPDVFKGYNKEQLIEKFEEVKTSFEKQIPNTESLALALQYLIDLDIRLRKKQIKDKDYFEKIINALDQLTTSEYSKKNLEFLSNKISPTITHIEKKTELLLNEGREQHREINAKLDALPELITNIPQIYQTDKLSTSVIKRSNKEKYYSLWAKLKTSKFFSSEFHNIIEEISKEECKFIVPSFRIYHNAERILANSELFISELNKTQNESENTQFFRVLSLIIRNSYYNLNGTFSKNNLELLIDKFNKIEYLNLKKEELNKWLSFALCLLKDYRYCLNRKEFDKIAEKILNIQHLPICLYDEIIYEKSLLSFIELDFESFINHLENWKLSGESNVWSYLKKAMLLNILNDKTQKEEILELVHMSVSKTSIDQEKLWFYEILRYYDISKNISQNANYNEQINLLKSKGHYTLEDVKKSLIEKDSKNKIQPQEDNRYTIFFSMGFTPEDTVDWEYIKFIELIFKIGLPIMPNINFPVAVVNRNNWWEVFKSIKSGMTREVLALSIQYSGNDANEKYIRSISQSILFDRKISQKIKSEIFKKLSESFFYLYEKQDMYRPAFIYIISEIIGCLDYSIWKDYITKLWEFHLDNTKVISQKFYTTIWGLDKAISKFLPYIEDNVLLNHMLQKFYSIKNKSEKDNIELTALKYIEKIIFHNASFKFLDFSHKTIKETIENILQKNDLSRLELINIYYYNLKLSNDLKESIKKKLLTLELTDNLLLNWDILLELSDNDEIINNNICDYILENENIVFRTGISNDGRNRSFGGLNFNISETLNPDSSESHLNWTDEEIIRIYSILKRSLGLLKKFNSRKSFFPGLDDEEILNDMFVFLKSTSKILKEEKGYHKTIIKVKGLLSQYEIDDVSQALISNDANYIQKAIIKLYHHLKDSPAAHNKMEWLTLLMKIIKREEPKLELAIEYFEYTLTEILKEETWIRDYSEFYLKILNVYYHNSYEELDRIHVEYHLIKVAFFLKNQLGLKDSIIDYWIKIKEESEFQKIKQMDL